MTYAFETDIIPLIRNLIRALQPYAQISEIGISFTCKETVVIVVHNPFTILQSISNLVLQLIQLIPNQSVIEVRLQYLSQSDAWVIELENNAINRLPTTAAVVNGVPHFSSHALPNGTVYRLLLPVKHQASVPGENQNKAEVRNQLPQFYIEMRKRLRSHFTQPEKLVAALSHNRPLEASFLQKVNALIKANLHDEHFDTQLLCKALTMSRSQLFRRLKPLIRQAPATYIKSMRLQKAKELLETTELTVSEVAFTSGFASPSHFTKVFQRQYGLLPSLFQRRRNATNE